MTGPIPARARQIIHVEKIIWSFDEGLVELYSKWAPQDDRTDVGYPNAGLHHARPWVDIHVSFIGLCHVEYSEIGLDES